MRGLPLVLLACAGCSGGGSTPSGELAADAVTASSDWLALDLATGMVGPVAGVPDPADPAWRGERLLFRRLPAGAAVLGRAVADLTAEADEHPVRSQPVPQLWFAVHELNQRQWTILAGTRPWLDALPVFDPSPWLGDDLPAFGLSPQMAEAALDLPLDDGWRLDVPTPAEWERACLAGARSRFAWGDDPAAAATLAVCDSLHPQPVGGRAANAWGLCDMHGNVWELAHDGFAWEARGGAWDQPALTARASNRLNLQSSTIGWNVGLRPVLRR